MHNVPVASRLEEGFDPGLDGLHDIAHQVLFDDASVVVWPVAHVDLIPH